jgi:hypothetical protein
MHASTLHTATRRSQTMPLPLLMQHFSGTHACQQLLLPSHPAAARAQPDRRPGSCCACCVSAACTLHPLHFVSVPPPHSLRRQMWPASSPRAAMQHTAPQRDARPWRGECGRVPRARCAAAHEHPDTHAHARTHARHFTLAAHLNHEQRRCGHHAAPGTIPPYLSACWPPCPRVHLHTGHGA